MIYPINLQNISQRFSGWKKFFLAIIITFTTVQVDAQSSPEKNSQNSASFLKNSPEKSAARLSGKFLTGVWSGKGYDIINLGFQDSVHDGYNYDIELVLSTEDEGDVKLNGTASVVRKTESGNISFTRKFSGTGIRSGNVLRINYQFLPEKDDNAEGVGIMIIQFTTPDKTGSGFYVSRSPKSGAMVNGKLALNKQ